MTLTLLIIIIIIIIINKRFATDYIHPGNVSFLFSNFIQNGYKLFNDTYYFLSNYHPDTNKRVDICWQDWHVIKQFIL